MRRSEFVHPSVPRLPTRCPSCKGSLIQRMPRPTYAAFISFHCLFCKHIWKFHLDDPRAGTTGELTGDVYIVTKRKARHKFASVTVCAVPEEGLKKHLASKRMQADVETRTLQRDIDRLSAMLRMAQTEEDRLWQILKADEEDPRKAEAWSLAYNRSKSVTKQLEQMQARRRHLTSGDYFFEDLPSGVSTAKTDVEGQFTLSIPRRGRYCVVARASRELLKGSETYFWCVWVSLDGHLSRHVMLNNDNVVGAGSPDSAL